MTADDFELQHANIPQPKLLDEDPVNDAPWPMPPGGRWQPRHGFNLARMCGEARGRLAEALEADVARHKREISNDASRARMRVHGRDWAARWAARYGYAG